MKTLILLILFTSLAVGQDNQMKCYYPEKHTHYPWVVIDTVGQLSPHKKLALLWDKYVKRLNNDFDMEVRNQIKISSEVFKIIQIEYSDDEVIISYPKRTLMPDVVTRTKPTIEGFMNFIKRED